jgi:microcystin degradation protein MlrC
MLDRLKTEADVQICPLMWASALPNGLVEANAYARLKGEMLARLEAEGPFDGVTATFHTRRVGLTIRQQFHQLGIDPQAHAVYVVKLGYLFPELAEIAGRIILLLSPGVAGLDFPSQKWVRVPRPIYPLDAGMTWDIG